MQASVNNPPFLKMEQIRGWQYSFQVFQDYLYAEFVANKFIFVNPKKVKSVVTQFIKNTYFFSSGTSCFGNSMANHPSKWDFFIFKFSNEVFRKVKKLRQTPKKHVVFPEKECNTCYFELSLKYVLTRLLLNRHVSMSKEIFKLSYIP